MLRKLQQTLTIQILTSADYPLVTYSIPLRYVLRIIPYLLQDPIHRLG